MRMDQCLLLSIFSVAKATLQSQMSVCLFVCPSVLKQNPSTAWNPHLYSSFIILHSSFLHFATFKLFSLFFDPSYCGSDWGLSRQQQPQWPWRTITGPYLVQSQLVLLLATTSLTISPSTCQLQGNCQKLCQLFLLIKLLWFSKIFIKWS